MPNKGYKSTEEHKRNLSIAHLGLPSSCGMKGKKHTEESKKKMSVIANLLGKGKWMLDKKHSQKTKLKMSLSHKGKKHSLEHNKKVGDSHRGEKSYNYIKDRTQLKKSDERRTTACREWRKNTYKRDIWKCKINNQDCDGKIESHHILNWIDYPELRYDINNGITLCHFHHPRGRKEEIRLSLYLQELLKEKN